MIGLVGLTAVAVKLAVCVTVVLVVVMTIVLRSVSYSSGNTRSNISYMM